MFSILSVHNLLSSHDSDAFDVEVSDAWNPELFELKAGAFNGKWDLIPSYISLHPSLPSSFSPLVSFLFLTSGRGGSATHTLVLVPRETGTPETRRASVSYKACKVVFLIVF